jgi:hypothetical protein
MSIFKNLKTTEFRRDIRIKVEEVTLKDIADIDLPMISMRDPIDHKPLTTEVAVQMVLEQHPSYMSYLLVDDDSGPDMLPSQKITVIAVNYLN